MKLVFKGSLKLSWIWDGQGGVYFADAPGGHTLYLPHMKYRKLYLNKIEMEKWKKKNE